MDGCWVSHHAAAPGCVSAAPRYEACLANVDKVLYQKVVKASEVADVDFYAFSYYYDRAVDLGLIGRKLRPRGAGSALCCNQISYILTV